jgi:hypothetical protein
MSDLKLYKNNALAIGQLANKAKKKIPLYEMNKSEVVRITFLDLTVNKQRYLKFSKLNNLSNEWTFIEVVD